MPHIFISYAKKDTQELAFALCDWFNQLDGYTAWVDRSLTAGRSWEGTIQREILRGDIFVVLYSPDINRHLHDPTIPESYVLEEISYARYTLKKTIIPVMAQQTEPPMGMTRIQYINFAAGGMSINALTQKILQEVGQMPSSPSAGTQVVPIMPPLNRPRSIDLLPAPFAWIEIPGGFGGLKMDKNILLSLPTERYWISKYPVTNVQFAKFIEAGGYSTQRWWTETGWLHKQWERWTKPYYWNDSKWNGAEQPVVGVSWFEAVAFCLWLSDVTGEKIMLPTEAQWQYAAQGDDKRDYPWGNDWDGGRCNNNVDEKGIGKTTSVLQYEGKGNSPFGVVDMTGNIWEWCVTDYQNRANDINGDTNRVQRGGSWNTTARSYFRCAGRISEISSHRGDPGGNDRGFRISRS